MKQLPFVDSVISIANTINLITKANLILIGLMIDKRKWKRKSKCFAKKPEPLFDNKYNKI
jgi:hypothetical protein